MALEVRTALIGTPNIGDEVKVTLEDSRELTLSFGTTIQNTSWEILSSSEVDEVEEARYRGPDVQFTIAATLTSTVAGSEIIAVGEKLQIQVQLELESVRRTIITQLSSAIASISVS